MLKMNEGTGGVQMIHGFWGDGEFILLLISCFIFFSYFLYITKKLPLVNTLLAYI